MFKLFLFVAFLAFAAAAPGSLLAPVVPYSAPIYSSGIAAAPLAYSAYSAPLTYSYGYNPISPYAYKASYYAL